MDATDKLEIFLAAPPGLEGALRDEARELGFADPRIEAGGVSLQGGLRDVWRANLWSRGATRALLRVGAFPASHLAQLDKRARALPWSRFLRPDVPVRVEASCKKSKIYHSGAAAERIARAIREELGAPAQSGAAKEGAAKEGATKEGAAKQGEAKQGAAAAELRVMVRIESNLCTVSLDTSGEPLHKRGFKQAVGKAPLRETMAALFLRQCGYRGDEPVVDPMCGSGTQVIEAAEIAAGLAPGRARAFAFERMAGFDAGEWAAMRAEAAEKQTEIRFFGADRDAGAVEMSRANAARAGVAAIARFEQQPVGELAPPQGSPTGPVGLVMVNPPYGARIGEAEKLFPLYRALGQTLIERFSGWRVGLITTEAKLAGATGLPFRKPGPPIPHGALRIRLFHTDALP